MATNQNPLRPLSLALPSMFEQHSKRKVSTLISVSVLQPNGQGLLQEHAVLLTRHQVILVWLACMLLMCSCLQFSMWKCPLPSLPAADIA